MKFIFDWKWYEGMLHTGEIIRDEQEKKKWAASDGKTEEEWWNQERIEIKRSD